MEDIQKKISELMSDPDAMSKINELSKAFGLGGQTPPAQKQTQPEVCAPAVSGGEPPSVGDMLKGLTQSGISQDILGSIMRFAPILSDMGQPDETTYLLTALRPFLSTPRQERLEQAAKMLKIMRVLPMIRSTGIF